MTRRILLIEDEPISQDIIGSLLVGQGYRVDVVTNGFDALDRAKTVGYDAALIDYHLPEMDGYALARLLREQRIHGVGAAVLIGLTADRNGLAARRGADAVFQAILPKPIKPSELFETIERLCRERGGAPDEMTPEPAPAESARLATAAIWRSHGLAAHPKAFVCPPPAADQAAALGLCFDLVGAEQAQLVVLLERHGINEAIRTARRPGARRLPVMGLSDDHGDICDGLFRVDDAASWRALAVRLGASPMTPAASGPGPDPAHRDQAVAAIGASPEARTAPPAANAAGVRAAGPAPVASAAHPDLRRIVLDGIRAPLVGMRKALETQAKSDPAAWASQDGVVVQIGALDQVLLMAGAVADFLKAPGAGEPDASVFDPAEMARNAVAMIGDAMAPGGPVLHCRIDACVPARVRGDVHRLSQIVLTLLDDACGLAAGGSVTLHLSFAESGEPELSYRLTHEPQAAEGDMLGAQAGVVGRLRRLRIAMLAQLVETMGGRLASAASAAEPLFRLIVPATRERETALQAEASLQRAASLLLIDEGGASGQILTLLLTQAGHSVRRVDDVEAALFACRDGAHDIALFDVAGGSPARLRSLDALRRFRQAQPAVPVLVLAPDLGPRQQADLAGVGIEATLQKPFAAEALQGVIARLRPASPRSGPGRAGLEPIDHGVRDALLAALGEPSVERLTDRLLRQIETFGDGSAAIDASGAARLVELASCASVLGLAELAARCAAFETQEADADQIVARDRDVRAAIERAKAALGARLQAA